MGDFVTALLQSPIANLFILAGILFLGIAVVGNVSGKIQPGTGGRILSGLIGVALMGAGLAIYSSQTPPETATPTDIPAVEVKLATTESSQVVAPTTLPTVNTLVPTVFISPTQIPTLVPAGFRVIETFLRADPFNYSGVCPVMITFSGRISVAGGGGTVSYKWIRNDGASAPVETLTFDGPGSKDISTTWYIGGSGMTYSGWEAIQIFDPQPLTSEHADFNIQCQ